MHRIMFTCDRLFMHTGGLGGYGSGDSEDERSSRVPRSSDTDENLTSESGKNRKLFGERKRTAAVA